MNENTSSNAATSAAHHGLTAEAISRRAYELWEQEGRPEARDLHHWLRAEQQLLAEMGQSASKTPSTTSSSSSSSSAAKTSSPSSAPRTDAQPLQGTRAGAAANKAVAAKSAKPAGARSGGR
jgi:hypothetical protein